MVKITAKLYIETQQAAKEMFDVISQILLKIASFPQTVNIMSNTKIKVKIFIVFVFKTFY